MKCHFEYCIYNRDFECIIEEPEINSLGMCGARIVIALDEKFLENEKERQLRKLESRWVESADHSCNGF